MPPPFLQALHVKKGTNNASKNFEVLRQVKVNIPLLDMIKQVSTYAKFLKDLCTVKKGLNMNKKAFLTKQVSVMIQCKSPVKYKDLGCPTISVSIGGTCVEKAFVGLGSKYRSMKIPRGMIEDVLVQVDKFYYPLDFVVLNTDPVVKGTNYSSTSSICARSISIRKKKKVQRKCAMIDTLVEEHCDQRIAAKEEPPKLILKPLPTELKYAYLEEDKKCPVVISSALTIHQEDCLLEVLRRSSSSTSEKVEPSHARGGAAEVLKLLQAGIIYPISDSPWVSPTQVVPKKSGSRWCKMIREKSLYTPHYRLEGVYRLQENAVTRKDHFPLPFIDQVLERVSGHPFYCFLDGYSGRMSFGLCNAPATFQRCMLSIFSDMVERIMECLTGEVPFHGTPRDCPWHIISKQGIEVDKAKVELIVKLPSPTNVKGDAKFIWDDRCQRSFEELKLFLTTTNTVLGQREDGKPYVIYYASKTLNEAQRNYTTTEKELLAVVFALDKFRAYLMDSLASRVQSPYQRQEMSGECGTDHLSRLAIAHNSHGLPINDDFPEGVSHVGGSCSLVCSHCELPSHMRSSNHEVLQSGFCWPSLFKDTHTMCKSCDRCQRLGKLTNKNMMPLNPILIVDLFYVWGIDFMGPFPMSFGYSYILVGVDYVLSKLKSRWIDPFTIYQVYSNGVVELFNSNSTGSFKMNDHYLKPFVEPFSRDKEEFILLDPHQA
ncbi:putative mitochondrial protein [Vitis vinifera]|uniref:Putative mitochondrial protein n=1 Tax=Vitis vinifera TaxID=29760 RepID=A0A438CIT6_VITVI|nr:putative mitochondrial protein [Vitis vinifera]